MKTKRWKCHFFWHIGLVGIFVFSFLYSCRICAADEQLQSFPSKDALSQSSGISNINPPPDPFAFVEDSDYPILRDPPPDTEDEEPIGGDDPYSIPAGENELLTFLSFLFLYFFYLFKYKGTIKNKQLHIKYVILLYCGSFF